MRFFSCSPPGWFSADNRWSETVMPAPSLILALLFVVCFTLATWLQPWHQSWAGGRAQSDSLLGVVMGNSRQLFANHFFTKADIYFHSGYYPSIFDSRPAPKESHMTGHGENHQDKDHEKEADFLDKPKDIFERFGRHSMITEHTHLEHGQEREIL